MLRRRRGVALEEKGARRLVQNGHVFGLDALGNPRLGGVDPEREPGGPDVSLGDRNAADAVVARKLASDARENLMSLLQRREYQARPMRGRSGCAAAVHHKAASLGIHRVFPRRHNALSEQVVVVVRIHALNRRHVIHHATQSKQRRRSSIRRARTTKSPPLPRTSESSSGSASNRYCRHGHQQGDAKDTTNTGGDA